MYPRRNKRDEIEMEPKPRKKYAGIAKTVELSKLTLPCPSSYGAREQENGRKTEVGMREKKKRKRESKENMREHSHLR